MKNDILIANKTLVGLIFHFHAYKDSREFSLSLAVEEDLFSLFAYLALFLLKFSADLCVSMAEMDRGACLRSSETSLPSTASRDRCQGCPKPDGRRFTTVRWQRFDSGRVNATEVLNFGDVKIFRPVESKWKLVVRKLKRYLAKVGLREDLCENGMRLGAASIVAACSMKNTKAFPISSPKPSIWQRRSSAPMPALNVPNSRSSRSRNESK